MLAIGCKFNYFLILFVLLVFIFLSCLCSNIISSLPYSNGVPVFRYRHQDFNFSSGEPSRSFLTIYRAIQVEHPVVLRQLVINNSVEKIILVEHRAEANRIATSGPNRTLPHNVTACYTLDGYNVGHRGGGNSTQTVNFWRGAPRLSRDVDKNIG